MLDAKIKQMKKHGLQNTSPRPVFQPKDLQKLKKKVPQKGCKSQAGVRVIYKLFEAFLMVSKHPAWVYHAGKPIENAVYCLNNHLIHNKREWYNSFV